MPERISDVFKIPPQAFESEGVFDRLVDVYSPFHIDPHLLESSGAAEMVEAAKTLSAYWQDTILIVNNIFEYGDRFWRAGLARFTFPENPSAGLGYAATGTDGAAVGWETATRLLETARDIVRAGVIDPRIFELVGLFEPKVGPDIISDITIHIIEAHLLEFTQRVCKRFRIPAQSISVSGRHYDLPVVPGSERFLILLPKDVLCELPVALCWSDLDEVGRYNEGMRARLNELVGKSWKQAVDDNKKEKLKNLLIENPAALSDLIEQYRRKPGVSYDFAADVLGETIWPEVAKSVVKKYPLEVVAGDKTGHHAVLAVVRTICNQFRDLVENCGLARVFWTDDKKIRHERFAQMLFFAIADAYCKANDLDLSPEVNSGRGPVDFKVSKGYSDRVLVEVKWSKNSQLVHGYEVQLKEYIKAERAGLSVFLVIQVGDSMKSVERVLALQSEEIRAGGSAPEVLVVDGRMKDSASHFN